MQADDSITEESEISAAITEIADTPQDQAISQQESTQEQPALPDAPTVKELARKYLMEKRQAGKNLTVKTIKTEVCNEIAERIRNELGSCSYQAVSKEIPFVLKADLGATETTVAEGHQIIAKKIEFVNRPPRKSEETQTEEKAKPESEKIHDQLAIISKMEKAGESVQELMNQYMLEDVANFIGALGLPKPKAKRIMILAKRITYYNEIQIKNGHPEKIIQIHEKLLKPLLFLGMFTTFAFPIVQKYFKPQEKADSTDLSAKYE